MSAPQKYHDQRWSKQTTWVTPRWVSEWLGDFDLDPCSFAEHPWPLAKQSLFEKGIETPWNGRVFLNPPYDSRILPLFMRKMADHSHGVAMVGARVETRWFQDFCFGAAHAILFPRGRIKFHRPDGTPTIHVTFSTCFVFYEPPPRTCPIPGTWWTTGSKPVEEK